MVREDHLFHVMRDQDHRHALLPVELPDHPEHLAAAVGIEHRGRLIHHNALGMHRHHARNRHTLLLPSGKTVRRTVAESEHADPVERLLHSCPDVLCRHAEIFRSEGHILVHHGSDDLIVRVLEDHAGFLPDPPEIALSGRIHVIHPHRPSGRNKQRVDLLGERRFSRSVVP